MSLAAKISDGLDYPNIYLASDFNNPRNLLANKSAPAIYPPPDIAIHIHAHDVIVMQEIMSHLQDAPYAYDLYLTYDNELLADALGACAASLSPKRLELIKVPNRGRDVAPWLLATRKVYDKYDIWGHFHTKASSQACWGARWRQYLYRNLISPEAFANAVWAFCNNPSLGCLFPAPFAELANYCKNHKIDQFGEYGEKQMIYNLLKRMNIDRNMFQYDIYFSMGTMMWYRPEALRQFFEFPLDVNEFGLEPIGVGGTIGHAIERMPAFVSQYNGYEAKMTSPLPIY